MQAPFAKRVAIAEPGPGEHPMIGLPHLVRGAGHHPGPGEDHPQQVGFGLDPRVKPALRFNYLSTDQDRREWVEAIRVARNILDQSAFDAYNGGETSPGPSVETDEEILDWVARDAETALHPSCTCRMGTDELSVVDPATMRVRGVDGLRVVDASSMPYVTNGNIYAPVVMLAEKAADLIRGDTPLPPLDDVPFYRYERAATA